MQIGNFQLVIPFYWNIKLNGNVIEFFKETMIPINVSKILNAAVRVANHSTLTNQDKRYFAINNRIFLKKSAARTISK